MEQRATESGSAHNPSYISRPHQLTALLFPQCTALEIVNQSALFLFYGSVGFYVGTRKPREVPEQSQTAKLNVLKMAVSLFVYMLLTELKYSI